MPLTMSKKTPANRLRRLSGSFVAKFEAKLSATSGNATITGIVPKTNPSITSAPVSASALIAAAASADVNVMQGSKAVTTPNPNMRRRPFRDPDQCAKRAVIALTQRGAHAHSRLRTNKHPWIATITANDMDKATPARGTQSLTVSETAATNAPKAVYEKILPALYRTTSWNTDLPAALTCAKRAQTSGPHIAAQCQDITKLNQTMDKMVAASIASTACKRCSK